LGQQIKDEEVARAYSMQVICKGKRPINGPKRKLEYNIKKDLEEIDFEMHAEFVWPRIGWSEGNL
jgi:hypothetical protein